MIEEYNIYEEEERIISDIRKLVQSENLAQHEYREALFNLLKSYERLFKETKHLIKISDRKEKELNLMNRRLKEFADKLEYQATHDALTGVFNRCRITGYISEALLQSDMVVIMYDIDHFKKINDSFGHMIGDCVLKEVVAVTSDIIGSKGALGRLGGEEFVVGLPDKTLHKGLEIAEKLRRKVEKTEFVHTDCKVYITISLGVTRCRKGENFEAIYLRADQALYKAKHNGRNRVEQY